MYSFKCSSSGKTDLSESSSHDSRGVPENSSSSTSRRPFWILLKFYLYWHDKGSLSHYISSSFVSLHSRSSSAKRNQVSFHAGLKPWCPVCSITH